MIMTVLQTNQCVQTGLGFLPGDILLIFINSGLVTESVQPYSFVFSAVSCPVAEQCRILCSFEYSRFNSTQHMEETPGMVFLQSQMHRGSYIGKLIIKYAVLHHLKWNCTRFNIIKQIEVVS